VLISVTVGIFGAYAFAMLRFRFRKVTMMVFLASYMLPSDRVARSAVPDMSSFHCGQQDRPDRRLLLYVTRSCCGS